LYYINVNKGNDMANNLPTEKKVTVISMPAEGASIRSIEQITGINRNTIMNLGVRVGNACQKLMEEKMRGLSCNQIQVDEIWGFMGAKKKNAQRTIRIATGHRCTKRSKSWRSISNQRVNGK
jgi:hypothetical protein